VHGVCVCVCVQTENSIGGGRESALARQLAAGGLVMITLPLSSEMTLHCRAVLSE